MSISLLVLDSITIASPCTVPWDEMQGDNHTLFCNKCSQNVHDVSELTYSEAAQFLAGEGKLPCLGIYRRPDGRAMTADCATRRERVWKWLHNRSALAASVFAIVFFMGCGSKPGECTAGIPAFGGHVDEEAVQAVAGGAVPVAVKQERGEIER